MVSCDRFSIVVAVLLLYSLLTVTIKRHEEELKSATWADIEHMMCSVLA